MRDYGQYGRDAASWATPAGVLRHFVEGGMMDVYYSQVDERLKSWGLDPERYDNDTNWNTYIRLVCRDGQRLFDKMVDTIIGSSKFVFMDSKGNIYHYGSFIKEGKLLFSNASYIDYSSLYGIRKKKNRNCYSCIDGEESDKIFDDIVDKISEDISNDPVCMITQYYMPNNYA